MTESAENEHDNVSVARADLAIRLSVDPGAIEVVSHVELDWPDAALGCPQPGMRYKQVVTNGTLTVLAVHDEEYRYHAGGGRQPFLCESSAGR